MSNNIDNDIQMAVYCGHKLDNFCRKHINVKMSGVSINLNRDQQEELLGLAKTGPNPSAASGKMKWIDKHLATHNFLLGRVKRFYAAPNCLLIDDKEKNCADFIKHGGNAFLWPQPYNKHRGLSHKDALEILQNLMSQWAKNG